MDDTKGSGGGGDKGDNRGGECKGPLFVIPVIRQFSPGLLKRKGSTLRERKLQFASFQHVRCSEIHPPTLLVLMVSNL